MKNLLPILLLGLFVAALLLQSRLAARRRRLKVAHNRWLRRRSYRRWKRYGGSWFRSRRHKHNFK